MTEILFASAPVPVSAPSDDAPYPVWSGGGVVVMRSSDVYAKG